VKVEILICSACNLILWDWGGGGCQAETEGSAMITDRQKVVQLITNGQKAVR
jgi:hypothetical protein